MPAKPKTWTCQSVKAKQKCAHVNPKRKQLCEVCGWRRPASKRPAHRAIMDYPYEIWVTWFFKPGEPVVCMLCGREPTPGKKLNRDHGHSGTLKGKARGLICFRCNRWLAYFVTAEWLRAAADYLEAAESRAERP